MCRKSVSDKISKKPTWRVQPLTRSRARTLRTNSTRAEQILWRTLRAHRLNGVGFRRQTPIGAYIVDFVSHAAKLIVEVDGGQHFDRGQQTPDAARDRVLRSKGLRVLRFSNYDVTSNLEGVWEVIAAACVAAVSPSLPSPASGGGKNSTGDLPLKGGGEVSASAIRRI
jgi:very-short-patch-repair endonuclease